MDSERTRFKTNRRGPGLLIPYMGMNMPMRKNMCRGSSKPKCKEFSTDNDSLGLVMPYVSSMRPIWQKARRDDVLSMCKKSRINGKDSEQAIPNTSSRKLSCAEL